MALCMAGLRSTLGCNIHYRCESYAASLHCSHSAVDRVCKCTYSQPHRLIVIIVLLMLQLIFFQHDIYLRQRGTGKVNAIARDVCL